MRSCLETANASFPLPLERANIQRDAKGLPYSINMLLQDVDSSFVKQLKVAFHHGAYGLPVRMLNRVYLVLHTCFLVSLLLFLFAGLSNQVRHIFV